MAIILLDDLGISAAEIASNQSLSVSCYLKAKNNVTAISSTFDRKDTNPIDFIAIDIQIKIVYYTGASPVGPEYFSKTLPGIVDNTNEHYMFVEKALIHSAADGFDIFVDYKYDSTDPLIFIDRIQINRGDSIQPYDSSTFDEVEGLTDLYDPVGDGSNSGYTNLIEVSNNGSGGGNDLDLIRWEIGTDYEAIVTKSNAVPTGGTEGDIHFQTGQADAFVLDELGDVSAVPPWDIGDLLVADTTSSFAVQNPSTAGFELDLGLPLTSGFILASDNLGDGGARYWVDPVLPPVVFPKTVKVITTNYTVIAADEGNILQLNSGSAVIDFPDLRKGFMLQIYNTTATGPAAFTTIAGDVENVDGHTKIGGENAMVTVFQKDSANWLMTGDTQA